MWRKHLSADAESTLGPGSSALELNLPQTWGRVMLTLMEIDALWLFASVGWMWEVWGSLAWVVSPAQTGLGAHGGWKHKGKEKWEEKRQEPPDVEKCGEVILGEVKLSGAKGWENIMP